MVEMIKIETNEQLTALITLCKELGVTRLKLGTLEIEVSKEIKSQLAAVAEDSKETALPPLTDEQLLNWSSPAFEDSFSPSK